MRALIFSTALAMLAGCAPGGQAAGDLWLDGWHEFRQDDGGRKLTYRASRWTQVRRADGNARNRLLLREPARDGYLSAAVVEGRSAAEQAKIQAGLMTEDGVAVSAVETRGGGAKAAFTWGSTASDAKWRGKVIARKLPNLPGQVLVISCKWPERSPALEKECDGIAETFEAE